VSRSITPARLCTAIALLALAVVSAAATPAPAGAASALIATIVAGTSASGFNGDDQLATSAMLHSPSGFTKDPNGNIVIGDSANNRVRKIDKVTGFITTIAGTGLQGYNGDNILATTANLYHPGQVEYDAAGNLYIADEDNNRIRRVDAATGFITTVVGTGSGAYNGENQTPTNTNISTPTGLEFDPSGRLLVAEFHGNRVRRVDFGANTVKTVAGNGSLGFTEGAQATATGIATWGTVLDAAGNIYIGGYQNNAVVRVDALTGKAHKVASVQGATGITMDGAGNLLVAAWSANKVLQIDPSNGTITVFAGTGLYAYNGDGLPVDQTNLAAPIDVAVNADGSTYVLEQGGRLREVSTPTPGSLTGTVTASGGPADNVYVVLYRAGTRWATVGATVTAADGTYHFDNVYSGSYRVRVLDFEGRYQSGWFDGTRTQPTSSVVIVPGGSAANIDIDLAPKAKGALNGTVTGGPSNVPKANVWVQILDDTGFVMGTKTDANGVFHAGGLPAGPYFVRFVDLDRTYPNEWFRNAPTSATRSSVTVPATGNVLIAAHLG